MVTGRQEDDHIAIYSVTLQIAFQRLAMNLDVLHGDRLCARNHRRHLGLDLRHARPDIGERQQSQNCKRAKNLSPIISFSYPFPFMNFAAAQAPLRGYLRTYCRFQIDKT